MRDIVRLKTEREIVRVKIHDGNAFWNEIGVNDSVSKLMLLSLNLLLPVLVNAAKLKLTLPVLVNAAKLKHTAASITLHLKDAKGTDCLPTATIFAELERIGAKTTAWNESSSTIASAIICLATNQIFNFSKYIVDNMVKNLKDGVKFLMYPRITPLFQTMMVQAPKEVGEGTAVPTDSHHTTTQPSTSRPQKKQSRRKQITKPLTSSTIRETIRQEVEIPQSNFPTQTPVADEATFTCVDVVHGGAATTVSSIDAGQSSGNITKSPTMAHDSPLPGSHTLGSDKGSMTLHDLTVLCTQLSNKVESLETELKQTKKTYGATFTRLIKRVKKLKQTIKTSQARRITNITASDDKDDLVGRYGHNLDTQEGFGAGLEVTTADEELNTASTFVSTASPQRHADTTVDDLTLAETLMEIRKSAPKAKGKSKIDEIESPRKMKQREQDFTDSEWDNVLARIVADEDFVQQLQADEKCSEEDLPMKIVELVNQRKIYWLKNKELKARGTRTMTPAQQKEYMSTYIKNQKGGYSIKQLKSLSFDQVKEIFETTMRKVQSFVPMDSELEVQRLKRAGEEQSAEKEKELSEEELQKLLVVVPVEEVYIEALQVKYPIIDWEVYSEDTRSTTEPTDDKEKELWVELKRLFEPDNDDTLWKLQRYMHDPLVWRLYDTCGVHHVSSVRGHEIFMLVEKEYPLTRGIMTVMLANKLQVDQYSEMANELLRKIFILANKPRH
ncbi:hypothetical protein Tco_0741960 [Tanacetum coccineum]